MASKPVAARKRRAGTAMPLADLASKPGAAERAVDELVLRVLRLEALNRELESCLVASKRERQSSREVLDSLPVGVVQLDETGVILSANGPFGKMIGGSDRRFVGFNLSARVHREDLFGFIEHLRRCKYLQRPATVELRLRGFSGKDIHVQIISARTGEHRSNQVIQSIVINSAERNAARALLEQSQHRFQTMLETIEGIVWEADGITLDVCFVSRFADQLMGYPSDRWLEPGFWENHIHFDDRDRVMAIVSRALAERKNFSVDYRVISADHKILWIHDQVSIRVVNGKSRLLGIAVDITDQKNVELQLKESQASLETRVADRTAELRRSMSDLETFSYGLSHDLRAPLRAIRGYSELLQTRLGGKLNSMEAELLTRVQHSARRMDDLIQDVLRYGRIVSGSIEIKPVNLEHLINSVIRDYPNLQPPHAEVVLQKPLARVMGHDVFMTQCVSNLLGNAVKFVDAGTRPKVSVFTTVHGPEVDVCFEDNGFGISREDQKRIFGMFNRLHHPKEVEGTGMGLAIVKKAAERMGGCVGVDSQPGKGSLFWIRLPAAS